MNTVNDLLSKELPLIGQEYQKFVDAFGQPLSKDDNQASFDLGISQSEPLKIVMLGGIVNNINLSLPCDSNTGKKIAHKFMPDDISLSYVLNELRDDRINPEFPVSVYEYSSGYAKSLDGKGYDLNQSEYITLYLTDENELCNIVVAIGQEEIIENRV